MLLNLLGQPTLIHQGDSPQKIIDLVNAPLLLCHKDGLVGLKLPINWCGCLYKSEFIKDEDIEKNEQMPANGSYSIVNLVANETIDITLSNDSVIQLALVPLDENNENFMFIIQDTYVTNLVTDNFPPTAFNAFGINELLRMVIADIIDVLYINDTVFEQQPTVERSYPSELLLRCLVTLVQPRFIRGIGNNKLPMYLIDECCHIQNLDP